MERKQLPQGKVAKGTKNATDDFDLMMELKQAEQEALFSHKTWTVLKVKNGQVWYAKLIPKREEALAELEVVAQEIRRLFHPGQPKTRLAVDKDGNRYVLSKKVEGYTDLAVLVASGENVKQKIQIGEYQGVGDLTTLDVVLREVDSKPGNILARENMPMVRIDGDWSFAELSSPAYQKNSRITEATVRFLPICVGMPLCNWWDVVQGGNVVSHSAILTHEMATHPIIRHEINRMLLRIVCMPMDVVKRVIYHHASPEKAKILYEEYQSRANQMKVAAFANPEFIEYVKSPQAINDWHRYTDDYLKNLTLTGKWPVIEASELENIKNQAGVYQRKLLTPLFAAAPLTTSVAHGPTLDTFMALLPDSVRARLQQRPVAATAVDAKKPELPASSPPIELENQEPYFAIQYLTQSGSAGSAEAKSSQFLAESDSTGSSLEQAATENQIARGSVWPKEPQTSISSKDQGIIQLAQAVEAVKVILRECDENKPLAPGLVPMLVKRMMVSDSDGYTPLSALAIDSPVVLGKLFSVAKNNTILQHIISEAITMQGAEDGRTLLHLIANFAPQSIGKLLDAAENSKELQDAIAKSVVIKTDGGKLLNLISKELSSTPLRLEQLRKVVLFAASSPEVNAKNLVSSASSGPIELESPTSSKTESVEFRRRPGR